MIEIHETTVEWSLPFAVIVQGLDQKGGVRRQE